MLTEGAWRELYPGAAAGILACLGRDGQAVLEEFGIAGQRNRLHFFLAQIGHESSGLRRTEENLNYSAARMMQVWPSRFPTLASTRGLARNPQGLANKVYGGRMGNAGPNDGWTYRGRGLIQITGKDCYAQVGAMADLDLVGAPELARAPEHALRVACAFWGWKGIDTLCDAGDFTAVTRKINGGTVGLKDRFKWLERVQSLVRWPLQAADAG